MVCVSFVISIFEKFLIEPRVNNFEIDTGNHEEEYCSV